MKKEELETIISGMKTKLGEENSALIADDIGLLISDNSNMNKEIETRDNKIRKLKDDKEMLITTNGNLLKQVSMEDTEIENKKDIPEEKPKDFNFRNAFDNKGNFIF